MLNRALGELAQRLVSIMAILMGVRADRLQRFLLRRRGVRVCGPVYIGSGTRLVAPDRLTLGERVAIGEDSLIVCHAPVTIGEDFLSAPGLYINSGGHDVSTLRAQAKPVRVGARVWCGVRVTICAGVEIGDDAVIGAGAVVVKSIPSRSIAVGVPARVVGEVERRPEEFYSWYHASQG